MDLRITKPTNSNVYTNNDILYKVIPKAYYNNKQWKRETAHRTSPFWATTTTCQAQPSKRKNHTQPNKR